MIDPKPTVKLSDEDGNAYSILGRCNRSLRNAGANKEQIEEFMTEAKLGDYDHLLQTCFKWFEVE
jgi:hypothetical protein